MNKLDILNYIAKLINSQQDEFAILLQSLSNSGLKETRAGQEAIDILTLIHEQKRELLNKLYRDIQAL